MTNADKLDIDELERLLGEGTSGEWVAIDDAAHLPGGFEPNRVVDPRGYTVAEATGDDDGLEWANNTLIATLHNAAPALIAEVRRLRAKVAAADKMHHDICVLIDESSGVVGLHRNGDEASWAELLEGGAAEEWLMSLAAYDKTVAGVPLGEE